MKKIELTDGLPVSIVLKRQTEEIRSLTAAIISACYKSELSYVEMNKALYLADKELYEETIATRFCRSGMTAESKTINQLRGEHGLKPIPDGDALLEKID